MKQYRPLRRLVELGLVLQYDTGLQELGLSPILTPAERILINQERGRRMSGGDFSQHKKLEILIEAILLEIQKKNWEPKEGIQYK